MHYRDKSDQKEALPIHVYSSRFIILCVSSMQAEMLQLELQLATAHDQLKVEAEKLIMWN